MEKNKIIYFLEPTGCQKWTFGGRNCNFYDDNGFGELPFQEIMLLSVISLMIDNDGKEQNNLFSRTYRVSKMDFWGPKLLFLR